jgi:hypothetical protein
MKRITSKTPVRSGAKARHCDMVTDGGRIRAKNKLLKISVIHLINSNINLIYSYCANY